MSRRIVVIWDGTGTGAGHFSYTGDGTTLPAPKHKLVMTDLESVDWTCLNGLSGAFVTCEIKFDPRHCHHPSVAHACDLPEPSNHLANPKADHNHPYKYTVTIKPSGHSHDPEIQVESGGAPASTYGNVAEFVSDHLVAGAFLVVCLAALIGLYFYRRSRA